MAVGRRRRGWPAVGRSTVASGLLFAVLVAGAIVYTATGDAARDLLVQELLVNLVLVLGLQVFIGSTGILSFGHLAFAQIAAYATALARRSQSATKATSLPDLPFGLGDVELGPLSGDRRSACSSPSQLGAARRHRRRPAPVGWRRR